MSYKPSADEVKKLREETGAPMMDCRKALIEANGGMPKAKELLQQRGAAQAQKKEERVANEGLVTSYIHAGGKIGVLVEVNSETDFVARNPKFGELTRDIAMHIAAMSPQYIDRASVPGEVVDKARGEFVANVPAGKPPEVAQKIVEGKLNDFYKREVLLDQAWAKDDKKTIEQLLKESIAKLGENITISRFARFKVGEAS
jgi:elongation factor Ts